MGQWSELLADLLIIIDQHLDQYLDKIRFSCVCTHWQSTSPELPDLRQPQPPWLLLPYETGSLCGLYHPFEKKVYEIDLPEAGEKVFKGSGFGWVVTVQEDGSIDLVNPLTRVRLPLPPRYEFPDVVEYCPDKIGHQYLFISESPTGELHPPDPDDAYDSMNVRNTFTTKIALSCSPTSTDFIAVAIYRCFRLAYCKLGDKKWRDLFDFDNKRGFYKDVTFLDGKLYALTTRGELMICDDIASSPMLRKYVPIPDYGNVDYHDHLVNSSLGLMVVERDYVEAPATNSIHTFYPQQGVDTFYTVNFNVYKLDMSSSSWVHMERLDDQVLFMGTGFQLGISSKEFRGSNDNHIYFANHRFNFKKIHDCFDNGIFDLNDQSIKPLGYESTVPKICLAPIWVMPDPY